MALSNNNETFGNNTETTVHLKSLRDLENHGISTQGLGLEGENIDISTTSQDIQKLKADLETTSNKEELMRKFLQLEKQVASRESIMAVDDLKQVVEQEGAESKTEEQTEQDLLKEAESTIEAGSHKKNDVVSTIKDSVENSVQNQIESKLAATPGLSWITKIPGVGKWFTNGLIDTAKETESEKGFSLPKLFFVFILSWLGIDKILENSQKTEDDTGKTETVVHEEPEEKKDGEDTTLPIIEETPLLSEEGRQNIYKNAGKLFLLNISGMSFEKNANKNSVYTKIEEIKWETGTAWYARYLQERKNGNETQAYAELLSHIGLNSEGFSSSKDKETVMNIFEGFFGGVAFSIIKEKVSQEKIAILINNGKIEKRFGNAFAEHISTTPIEELTVKDISILLAFLIPTAVLQSGIEGINHLRNYLFGENSGEEIEALKQEIQDRKESILDPEFTLAVIASGEELYVRPEKDSEFRELLLDKGGEIEEIEKLISFKNTFLRNLFSMEKYTLGYDGFQEKLSSHLNYKEIITMYTFLDGNPDISQLGPLESSGVYYWITKLLSETNLDYIGELGAETLKENSPHLSNVEKAILIRNLQRILEQGVKILFAHNKPIDAAVKTAISEALESNGFEAKDGTITSIEWAIILGIMGGGLAVMKIPHTLGKILGFGIFTGGAQFGVYKLYEMGFFGKAKAALRPSEYELLDEQVKQITGKTIAEIANAEKNGVPVDELF